MYKSFFYFIITLLLLRLKVTLGAVAAMLLATEGAHAGAALQVLELPQLGLSVTLLQYMVTEQT